MFKKVVSSIFALSLAALSTTAVAEVVSKTNAKVNAVFIGTDGAGWSLSLISNYAPDDISPPSKDYTLYYFNFYSGELVFIPNLPDSAVTGDFKDSFSLNIVDVCEYAPYATTCGALTVELNSIYSTGTLTGMRKSFLGEYTLSNTGRYEHANASMWLKLPEYDFQFPLPVSGQLINDRLINIELVKGQAG